MKDHVTSLEISKKLKEAGIEVKCQWYYVLFNDSPDFSLAVRLGGNSFFCLHLNLFFYSVRFTEYYPAYLLSELLDMVEGDYKNLDWYNGKWQFDCSNKNKEARYYISENPIVAVAQAILWQKENKQ